MSAGTIPALTFHQPWASAIARGAKSIETRSWSTKHRGKLLIHAGKSKIGDDLTHPVWLNDCMIDFPAFRDLPFGAIIAVCDLVTVLPTDIFRVGYDYPACDETRNSTTRWSTFTDQELALGNFAPERCGWVLRNVRALPEPIPYRGKQGLWNVPAEILKGMVL
jgi:hypothetical protein